MLPEKKDILLDDGLGIDLSALMQKKSPSDILDTSTHTIPLEDTLDFTDSTTTPGDTVETDKEKEERITEEKRLADEQAKIVADEKLAEENKVAEEKKLSDEKLLAEKENNPYRIFANVLKEQAVIDTIPDDFTESGEGIGKLINDQVDLKVQNWIDNLPETAKYFVESHKEGIPLNSLLRKEAAIETYTSIDAATLESDVALQKSLIKDYLIKNEWNNTEIKEEIEENETSDTLFSKSKRYLTKLIQREEQEKKELVTQSREDADKREQEYEGKINNIRTTLKGMNEIFAGVKFTDAEKKIVFNGITRFDKDRKNDIMKFRENNPNFDFITTYLALVHKGDLSWLTKAALTKATANIKNTIDIKDPVEPFKGVDFTIIKNALKNQIF